MFNLLVHLVCLIDKSDIIEIRAFKCNKLQQTLIQMLILQIIARHAEETADALE